MSVAQIINLKARKKAQARLARAVKTTASCRLLTTAPSWLP